jgi:hypothetical protein
MTAAPLVHGGRSCVEDAQTPGGALGTSGLTQPVQPAFCREDRPRDYSATSSALRLRVAGFAASVLTAFV